MVNWTPIKRKNGAVVKNERDLIRHIVADSSETGMLTHEVAAEAEMPRYMARGHLNDLHASGEVLKKRDGRSLRWFAITGDDGEDQPS